MNDTLRRALFRARLTESDVAAQLTVDPKTVRRWLEGRLPYPRHRWDLANLLSIDETELWPSDHEHRDRERRVRHGADDVDEEQERRPRAHAFGEQVPGRVHDRG